MTCAVDWARCCRCCCFHLFIFLFVVNVNVRACPLVQHSLTPSVNSHVLVALGEDEGEREGEGTVRRGRWRKVGGTCEERMMGKGRGREL